MNVSRALGGWLAGLLVGALAAAPPAPPPSPASPAPAATQFTVDPEHSGVTFSVRHLTIGTITGRFRKVAGQWRIDPQTGALQELTGAVRADTIDTNNAKRDAHLRQSEFFNTDQDQELTIKLLAYDGDGRQGTLKAAVTMRGTTLPVAFAARLSPVIADPTAAVPTCRQAVTLTATLKRLDFKIGPSYGAAIIGHDVRVTVELEGACPAPAAAAAPDGKGAAAASPPP